MRTPESELEELRKASLLRTLRYRQSLQGRAVCIDGRQLVNFGSNDYLGLAGCSRLSQAGAKAAEAGGSGASRLISGGSAAHQELENDLAEFLAYDAALFFANGYATSLGVTGAVVGKGDIVLMDKRCHASLIDGARLSGATLRVFPHNGLEKLERLLVSYRNSIEEGARILIVTESIFSMDGDAAALAEIVALKRRFGALLMLDEAHTFGLIGPKGRGLAASLNLSGDVDFYIATLGKAAGAAGGFVAASRPWIELIANRARSFIFSTAPPAAQAATGSASLRELESEEGQLRRVQLTRNMGDLCKALDLDTPMGAIVPVIVGAETLALRLSAQLEEAGLLVPAIRYPTVAKGSARLRISVSAAHTREDVSALASALGSLLGKSEAAGPRSSQPA